jgi:hypothetical protein
MTDKMRERVVQAVADGVLDAGALERYDAATAESLRQIALIMHRPLNPLGLEAAGAHLPDKGIIWTVPQRKRGEGES